MTIERVRALLAKVMIVNTADYHFPWRTISRNGKPIIAGNRSGNLFNGYIATHDYADLVVEAINALPEFLATLDKLTDERARLLGVMRQCREQFSFYEHSHIAKNTQDGDEKAATNYRFKTMLDEAIGAAAALSNGASDE